MRVVRIDIYQSFDNRGWVLVPSQEILDDVHKYFQEILEDCTNGTMKAKDVKVTNWLQVRPSPFLQ